VLDKAEYSAFQSTLNSPIVSYYNKYKISYLHRLFTITNQLTTILLLAYDVISDLSAARVVLACFDSVRFHINFLTEIINILSLLYFHYLLFKCVSLAGKEKIVQPHL